MNKASKSVRILDLLADAGTVGLCFTDIQAALWVMSHPDKEEEFDCDMDYTGKSRRLRGYWCTSLVGGPHYHQGLLRFFAVKGADGRWRRNSIPHNDRPWATMSAELSNRAAQGRPTA